MLLMGPWTWCLTIWRSSSCWIATWTTPNWHLATLWMYVCMYIYIYIYIYICIYIYIYTYLWVASFCLNFPFEFSVTSESANKKSVGPCGLLINSADQNWWVWRFNQQFPSKPIKIYGKSTIRRGKAADFPWFVLYLSWRVPGFWLHKDGEILQCICGRILVRRLN